MKRPELSSGKFILFASIIITLLNNQVFFSSVSQRLDIYSLAGGGYIITFYLLMIGLLSFLFLIAGQKYFLKALIIVFIMLSATLSYFNQELGIIFDAEMIRNIVETIKDNNQQEALELLSLPLVLHLFLFGVIPSVLAVWIKVKYKSPQKELLSRLAYGGVFAVLLVSMVMLNFKYLTYFSRENRDLRVWITPVFSVVSAGKYIKRTIKSDEIPFKTLGLDAKQNKRSAKRTVGIMVVGETARADHFSLNGYARQTNPLLAKEDIVDFEDASSCGTSTAYSVPCMFSHLERDNYSPDKAAKESNLLDILTTADIKTIWVDNNSSCKGVCERVETKNIRNNPDASSQYFNDGEYYDERLIEEMVSAIKESSKDTLIVLHTLGSHGPSYYRRYPEKFEKFKPDCRKSSPQACSDEEVINAYDNTLLYTDYILSRIINQLKQHSLEYESFLVYASDHGESLGEKGVYLHGLPYFLAPKAQTHVPFLVWFSDSFKKNHGLNTDVLREASDSHVSHDNLFHTVLGLFDIESEQYIEEKDILRD